MSKSKSNTKKVNPSPNSNANLADVILKWLEVIKKTISVIFLIILLILFIIVLFSSKSSLLPEIPKIIRSLIRFKL